MTVRTFIECDSPTCKKTAPSRPKTAANSEDWFPREWLCLNLGGVMPVFHSWTCAKNYILARRATPESVE